MKWYVFFIVLFSFSGFADVPSNIQRTEIELEKGSLDIYRALVKASAATGYTSSELINKSGAIKNLEFKLGSKFIIGNTTDSKSWGIALSPDANVKIRLDDKGKLLRLEVSGRPVSILDLQNVLFANGLLSEEMKRFYEERKKILKIRLGGQVSSRSSFDQITIDELKTIDALLLAHEQAKKDPKAYTTIDVSILNGGLKYKDIKDGLYKFYGFNGSVLSASFDTAAKVKNGKITLGLCGMFDFLNGDVGHHKTKDKEYVGGSMGLSGQVCFRLGVGPVTLSNTFAASWDALANSTSNLAINNSARVGVKSEAISGTIAEAGFFHSYTNEWYSGGRVETNMFGAGITVLAK